MNKFLLFLVAGCFLHSFIESVGDSKQSNNAYYTEYGQSQKENNKPNTLKRNSSYGDFASPQDFYQCLEGKGSVINDLGALSPKELSVLIMLQKKGLSRSSTVSNLSEISDKSCDKLTLSRSQTTGSLFDDCIVKTPSPKSKTPDKK